MRNVRRLTILFVLAMALCGSGTAIAFDETDLKKLKALNSCSDCDLSVANLSAADLSYAKLSGNIGKHQAKLEVTVAQCIFNNIVSSFCLLLN